MEKIWIAVNATDTVNWLPMYTNAMKEITETSTGETDQTMLKKNELICSLERHDREYSEIQMLLKTHA
jgi:hypothetical protein